MKENIWRRRKLAGNAQRNNSRLRAALAYYSAFSLAPVLLIAMTVAALFFGRDAAQGRIAEQIQGLIGRDAAEAVRSMVKGSRHAGTGFFASVIGLVMLVLGGLGRFRRAAGLAQHRLES